VFCASSDPSIFHESQYLVPPLQLWPRLQVLPVHLKLSPALPDTNTVGRAGSHERCLDGGTELLVL
jgi:hypothetical protein